MKKCLLYQELNYDWIIFFQTFLQKKFFHGGRGGSKNIFFIFDTAEPKIFLNDLLEIAIQIFLTVAKKNAPWGKLFSFFQGRYQ